MTNVTDYPEVMDTAQVAEMLQLNIDTIRRLSRDGQLPSHRLPGGRSFRFLKDEVINWLRDQPAHAETTADATADTT